MSSIAFHATRRHVTPPRPPDHLSPARPTAQGSTAATPSGVVLCCASARPPAMPPPVVSPCLSHLRRRNLHLQAPRWGDDESGPRTWEGHSPIRATRWPIVPQPYYELPNTTTACLGPYPNPNVKAVTADRAVSLPDQEPDRHTVVVLTALNNPRARALCQPRHPHSRRVPCTAVCHATCRPDPRGGIGWGEPVHRLGRARQPPSLETFRTVVSPAVNPPHVPSRPDGGVGLTTHQRGMVSAVVTSSPG